MKINKKIKYITVISIIIAVLIGLIIYFSWQNRIIIYKEDIEIRDYMNILSQKYISEAFKITDKASLENSTFKISYNDGTLIFENKETGENLLKPVLSPLLEMTTNEDKYLTLSEYFGLFYLYNPFYERLLFPAEIIKKDENNLMIIYRTADYDVYPSVMLTKDSYEQIYKEFSEVETDEDLTSYLKNMYTFVPAGSYINLELKERYGKLFPKLEEMDMYFKRVLSTREIPIRNLIIKYSTLSPQKLRKDYAKAGNFGGYSGFVIFPLNVFLGEDKITITLDKNDIYISDFSDNYIKDILNEVTYNLDLNFDRIKFINSE